MYAGDGAGWSIPTLEIAALVTDDGDLVATSAESALVAGNAAGTVVVTVSAMDASAMESIRVVDTPVMP